MTIEVCNALAAGCSVSWDGVSAIATVAATVAALFIPIWQRRADHRERQNALAHSLLVKMLKIHSDLFGLSDHIREQRELAIANGDSPDTWGTLRAMATLPDPIHFTSEELAFLFAQKDDDTFNDVLGMDDLHSNACAMMRVYGEKREALTQRLPGSLNGTAVETRLSPEDMTWFAPLSMQLDMLVTDMAKLMEQNEEDAKMALAQLEQVIRTKLKMKIRLDAPEQKQPAAAS